MIVRNSSRARSQNRSTSATAGSSPDASIRACNCSERIRHGRIIKVRNSYDVLLRSDDQGPEIHRANDVVHHPPSGLVDDASGQSPPPGKKIASETSHHVHVRRLNDSHGSGQDDHDARASLGPCCRQTRLPGFSVSLTGTVPVG